MNFETWSDEDLEALAAGDMRGLSDEALEALAAPPRQYVEMGGEGGDVPMLTTTPPAPVEAPRRSLEDRVIGAADAALTAATGATGGLFGLIEGGAQEAANQALQGQFGTPEAAEAIERAATERAGTYTWQPRTEAGQGYLQALEPVLGVLPPVVAGTNPAMVGPGMRAARAAPGQVVDEVQADLPPPTVRPPPPPPLPEGAIRTAPLSDSVGAQRTPTAIYREIMAENFPVPFRGAAAPTAGQRTRDFDQLQWEAETAKTPAGAPLRQLLTNQQNVFRGNFDVLMEQFDPLEVEPVGIGTSVNRALEQRQDRLGSRVDRAYERAREAGDMEQPITIDRLPGVFDELYQVEGQVPLARSIRAQARRLGVIDDNGEPVPQSVNLVEELRKFVNAWTDFTDDGQRRVATMVNNAIDDAIDAIDTGPAYRRARGLARREFEEFKDTKIVADIMGTKGKTSERRIALEDVADRLIVRAPAEEMIKARNVMRRAGPEGDQAWRDLQAYGIQYIMNRALGRQLGPDGQPLIVPSQFVKVVEQFDRSNKLELLYGKRNAQTLRDLAELSRLLLTAPPGAVNYSNTASALRKIMSDMAMTGGDASSAVTRNALRYIREAVQDRRIRKQVDKALRGQMRDE